MTDTAASILIDPIQLHQRLMDSSLLILDATVELPAPRFDGDYQASSGYAGWLQAIFPERFMRTCLTRSAIRTPPIASPCRAPGR